MAPADAYWAAFFGCPAETMFAEPARVIEHSPALAEYSGIIAFFCEGRALISIPSACPEEICSRLVAAAESPATFADAFAAEGLSVVGPAFIGYGEEIPAPEKQVRLLTAEDRQAWSDLRASCSPIEWEHGGSELAATGAAGAFVDGKLAALAGYENWGDALAHLSVVTHPDFRGQGYGAAVVALSAQTALSVDLLPQYRTLEANVPSMRIAEKLGFERYATSVAVRLPRTA